MSDPSAELLQQPVTQRALVVVVSLVVLFVARFYVQRSLGQRLEDTVVRYRALKLTTWLAWIVVLLLLSVVFSDYLSGLGLALGVAGAGVAFALQEVIVSLAGWVAIIGGGFYRTGDRVQLGGIKGDVIDVGVIRTTLFEVGAWIESDNYNGRIVRVANSFVFKEPVFNYSADFTFLWDEIRVPVRHDSDRRLAREILERVADEVVGEYSAEIASTWRAMTTRYMIEPARVEPSVTMTMDENWLTYTLRYVVGFRGRRGCKDLLFRRILDEFDGTGGRVRVATVAQEVTVVAPDGAVPGMAPPSGTGRS